MGTKQENKDFYQVITAVHSVSNINRKSPHSSNTRDRAALLAPNSSSDDDSYDANPI